ncbi:MAG: hypothetical protein AB1545_12945 [Thermodesulfobacteriota bacterium]
MRSFRNSMKSLAILFICGLLAVQACNAEQGTVQGSKSSQVTNPYFPLSVGNSWTYRCSVEGQFQFTKTINITSADILDERQIYRAELRINNEPKSLVSYFIIEANGQVLSSLSPGVDAQEILITAVPSIGDKIGKFTVASKERSTMKTFPTTDVVRLENFSVDDPEVPEDKRLEWRSRTYGREIGLVEEADGLGGECVLYKFSQHAPTGNQAP